MASHADISVELRWNNPTWIVHGRSLCWQRSFSRADLVRFEAAGEAPPDGDIIAITVSSLAEKDALLFGSLPGFFTIAHFNGYPAVLVALASARSIDVIPLLDRMRVHLLSLPKKRASSIKKAPAAPKPKKPKRS